MKCLTAQQANEYLNSIGMKIGDWNRITDIAGRQHGKPNWINYRAPKDGLGLLNFSHHVAGWLSKGDWKIFQIDHSTGWMDPVQASLFGGLLFGSGDMPDLVENRTFLFEFGENKTTDENTELLISNLIFVFLLFESHGYVVSSNSNAGQLLGIQDGFVYFFSKEKNISGAEVLLKNFERNPLAPPQWIIEIFAERQEHALVSK